MVPVAKDNYLLLMFTGCFTLFWPQIEKNR